ncbi:NAD(P)/FAD-dependent oxidoreductase [Neokomagataea thailandica]|uniref:FAD dependent oxidoreductase n=1 Tax=Neokomagataea tanensis NBRC 106556 TaxID=1223519 RepID=A0ABQ0QIV3_9PROT|nr:MULTISPECIES: FAD-dependent oxidoreductase [Neokomagataea]GBR46332.1 FAD dependent oxidoreductase [Neokomagataea tanensis NBRC 106556]
MKFVPYWLDSITSVSSTSLSAFPAKADVVIVGGGFTGLSAARTLAKAGKSVVVLEADQIACHASGRNGGHVNNGTAGNFQAMVGKYGLEQAVALYHFFDDAVDTVENIVTTDKIACDFRRCGKLKVAWTHQHLANLRADQEAVKQYADPETDLLDREAVTAEIGGSTTFEGGILYRKSAQMHVGRFGYALAAQAMKAGAQIFENTPMMGLRRVGNVFEVSSSAGVIQAKNVLLATGTSRKAPNWFRRRIMPVGSFIVATAPMPEDLFARILPGRRNVVTTRNIHNYFRTTEDRRLIFGGRANFSQSSEKSDIKSGQILHTALTEIYPELASTDIDYCWGGNVDMSVDRLPHAGEWNGVTYAMGLSGHGVQMSVHLGQLLGRKLAGEYVNIPVWNQPWSPIPAYGIAAHFMPVVGAYFRAKDRYF